MFSEGTHPIQIQKYSSGIVYDLDPESVFGQTSGNYIDAHNAQSTSNDGNTGAIEKIKGEVLLYPNATSGVGYKCIGSAQVNEYLAEAWAPTNPAFPGIIRVNGVIVLSSTAFDIKPNFPLWQDKNEASEFSEWFVSDKRVPPFVFELKDMVDSLTSDPNKYFSAFDPALYQINIQSALDRPMIVDLINVGGGGGLATGQYQYQMRYASLSGDRTQWSHPTPMVAIPQALSSDSDQYPYAKTRGGAPNAASPTSFAPKLRFRVTNLYDYDFIEIKRTPYNLGAGITYTSNGVIVARIDVGQGEISVREYIDPQESNINIPLSAEDDSRELAHVENAGPIKYFDRRLELADVTLASKQSELTFLEINDKQGFPVINKLGKAGYSDPYNQINFKSEMRGEKVGYGVNLYDCVGNKGYVTKIPDLKNYQFPNRRDYVSVETKNYSRNGVVRASGVLTGSSSVGDTHEVFDTTEAIAKTNICDFKNVVEKGRVFGATGTKFNSPQGVTQDCNETNGEIERHGAQVTPFLLPSGALVSTAYFPFTPVSQNDPDVDGHDYIVTNKVNTTNIFPITVGPGIPVETPEHTYNNEPLGFAPNYYAMGMMIAGVDNFPAWAKAFSIVKTQPAKRVVCQGLAYYSLIKAEYKLVDNASLGGKSTNKFWFYAPDIENGIVASDTVNDIITNPQNYSLQFVSPLGFFSEFYSGEDNSVYNQRGRCVDMISYVRMIRDAQEKNSHQMNPGEDSGMGIDGGDGYSYVGYDKYRNQTVIPNTFSGDTNKGNKIVAINQIKRISEGRGTYLELVTEGDIYASTRTGGEPQFDDDGLKNWTEPVYVVNIIRTGANVPDNDLEKYRQTTHYQKLESIIGKSTGIIDQKFILVDERWEDCIPSPKNGQYGYSVDRFLYVKLTSGEVQKWINVTYKTPAQKAAILSAIAAGTGPYGGAYTHNNISNLDRFYEINFNIIGNIPPENSLILVRYDNTAPISCYGGDTYINEAIFAPIDSQASARDDAGEDQFPFGIGLPYKCFKLNPRYYTIRKAGASVNAIQDHEWFTLGYIRQLCVMFTVESQSALHLSYNTEYPLQSFPKINYVIRPNRWDDDKSIVDNHIFDQYVTDYKEDEKTNWKWGGFRFLPQINPDYSISPPIAFFSAPKFGFEERLSFPTRFMWSLPRAINAQNSPSIKTFPANNSFDIDDRTGAIKYIWRALTSKGENLYAITEKGVCLLFTKKDTLTDKGLNTVGFISRDAFINDQMWLEYTIGVNDQMWRSVTESVIPITLEDGSQIIKQALFFANRESIFRLMDDKVIDIARINYHSKIFKQGLNLIQPGYDTQVTGVFDFYKQQFYLHINGEDVTKTFVFSQKNNSWFGTNDFTFDRFTTYANRVFGHKDLKTYELNQGYVINGDPIEMRVVGAASPDSNKDKEFIRIRINSSSRPTFVGFKKEKTGVTQCFLDISKGARYLKNYNGWEGYIGRIESSVNINRPRLQGRLLIFEISHNLAEEFKIIDTAIQFKLIKT